MLAGKHIRTLALSSTALAVSLASVAVAQPIEEVTVTGTHIRGVAPVGSTVISVGSEDLQKTGATATSDFLLRVPQFVNIGSNEQTANGGSRVQGAAGNTVFTRSLNLRGISEQSTLTLYNGYRHTKGQLDATSDLDMFPVSLIERIEVVADGGSATYGTDAVAGTVNVVLKEPTDIIESVFQVGLKDGGMDWLARQTLGVTWDEAGSGVGDGGLLLTYQHSYTDPIDAADRPNLYNDDLSPYVGPAGLPPLFASPGNVQGLTGAGITASTTFAVPTGIAGTGVLRLSALGAAGTANRQSVWDKAFPLPRITRDTVAGVFKQELTDWLTFSAESVYSKRSGGGTYGTTTTNQLSLSVPKTNPYSPCNPANYTGPAAGRDCPGGAAAVNTPALASTITTLYATINEFGTTMHRDFSTWQHGTTGRFDIELPYEWSAKLAAHYSLAWANGTLNPTVNNTALAQVLSGTGKPANVPFFNPFCDNTAAPCNDPITVAYIRATSSNTNTNWLNHYDIALNGPLFDLPGGTVRLAFGADWSKNSTRIYNFASQTAAIGVQGVTAVSQSNQTVRGLFAELYVPVIGAANAMPGIRALEITLAGRITDYSTFGSTQDPKLGFNWKPIDSLKIHGSWGTSFRAPSRRESDPFAASGIFIVNNLTCAQVNGINLAACPAGGGTLVSLLSTIGGDITNKPEEARTWSLGADWTPEEIPGLYASVNYYNIDLKDQINQASRDVGDLGAVNSGLYDTRLILNPAFFPTRAVNNKNYDVNGVSMPTRTQAEYNAFILAVRNDARYAATTTVATGPVIFLNDGRQANNGNIKTDGIDFQAMYAWDTDWGSAHVGASGTYVLNYKLTPVNAAPFVDRTNQFAFNTQFRTRLEAGLTHEGWSGTVFLNYTNAYDVDPALTHALAGPQFYKVDAYTTFDLSLGYDVGDETGVALLRNVQLAMVMNNVFDTQPPFMLNAAVNNPVLFDPMNAGAVGRYITLRIGKRW